MIVDRRSFLVGLIAAPAIVRAASLMPVKVWREKLAVPLEFQATVLTDETELNLNDMKYIREALKRYRCEMNTVIFSPPVRRIDIVGNPLAHTVTAWQVYA